ncbi:MAG: hypothetical protein EXR84_01620 [Gammaproteobacteria bacterium]|nr:hypothetical protein [Gammaproteobacteria bacterium]
MRPTLKKLLQFASSVGAVAVLLTSSAQTAEQAPLLTVKQVMNALLTPMTTVIWGAYELQTDAEWLAVENAALGVLAAGNLLAIGGAGDAETALALEPDWQRYNQQMISAARSVLAAVAVKDEEALSAAGNEGLYPPCESCHQQYQAQ